MEMSQEEAEAIISVTLEAVSEQYILPLMLALGTLTMAASKKEPAWGEWIAETLRKQASSCPDEVAGKVLLHKLASAADGKERLSPEEWIEKMRRDMGSPRKSP